MGDKFASDSAVTLITETGLVESRYVYLRQLGDGPARSFWQIEPATCIDNLQHYLKHWQNYGEKLWEKILEENLSAAIIHCRLKYWRVPKRMPDSLEGRASYWKKYYNTDQGKGTEEKYIDMVKEYLK